MYVISSDAPVIGRHALFVSLFYNVISDCFAEPGSLSKQVQCPRALTRCVKLWVAHAPGIPGTFFPPPRVSDPDMHHGTCTTHVPWCMPGSTTSWFVWSRWRGKRSRYSWRMRNPQFCVSGPWLVTTWLTASPIQKYHVIEYVVLECPYLPWKTTEPHMPFNCRDMILIGHTGFCAFKPIPSIDGLPNDRVTHKICLITIPINISKKHCPGEIAFWNMNLCFYVL